MKTLLIAAILALSPMTGLASTTQPTEQEQSDRMLAQMQERLKQMQALVKQLEKTKDPDKRRKLLAEHMSAMHQGMDGMRGMGGGMMMGMMGPGADHRGHDHAGGPPSPEMMQRRMDMMQMMMEQMMQHMQACQPVEKP